MSIKKLLQLAGGVLFLVSQWGLAQTQTTSLSVSPTKEAAKPVLNIQHWSTANGTKVYYVQSPEVAMAIINVLFDAGSSRDGEKPGLAQLTANMLNQGSTKLDADQIAAGFDAVGAQFGASVNRDLTVVSLQTLTDKKYFDPAFSLFTEILTTPSFPEKAFLRTQQQTLSALDAMQQAPDQIARKAFYAAVYGSNQGYGHPILGDKMSIAAMTAAALQNFYKQYYVAHNALITIVGNVSRQQAETLANQISEKLPPGNPAPALAAAPALTSAKTINIKFPSEQTHIILGQVGINYADANYFPLLVGNYALGGAPLTSILFNQVREQRGLAYSVGSVFMPLAAKGPFAIVLQTRNDQSALALQVARETLDNFIKQGLTEEQVNAAKSKIINSFPLSIISNDKISDQLATIGFYHLPLNYLDTYRDNISRVTSAQIKEAFSKTLHPDQMAIITVGNAEQKDKPATQ